VNTVRTLTENYELVIHEMIGTLREKQEEVAYHASVVS
jgi:hypothetical protein